MKALRCEIIIKNKSGQTIKYNYVTDVVIDTNIRNFTDTCKILIPKKIKHKGLDITAYIARNDEITVKLGYTEEINVVFDGYIKSVKTGATIEIFCENESYKLKQKEVEPKLYEDLKLADFIKEHLSEYDTEITDVELGDLRVKNKTSVAGVLDFIAKKYPLYFFFVGKTFFAGMPMTLLAKNQKTHKLTRGKHYEKNDIQYMLADDMNVQIVAKSILNNNKTIEAKSPEKAENAEIRTFYNNFIKSQSALQTFANEKLKTIKNNKIKGSVIAFGLPYIQKGDVIHLFDKQNKEINDKRFFVEKVNYKFGQKGYQQVITLGNEL